MADSDAWIPYRPEGAAEAEPDTPAPAEAEVPPPLSHAAPEPEDDVEVVDGLPVLADVRALEPARAGAIRVQAAAAAATGFVAGAATIALARRMAVRRLGRIDPQPRGPLFPASGTRTYLVHIRVLGRPPE
jgi:hypothetical protein